MKNKKTKVIIVFLVIMIGTIFTNEDNKNNIKTDIVNCKAVALSDKSYINKCSADGIDTTPKTLNYIFDTNYSNCNNKLKFYQINSIDEIDGVDNKDTSQTIQEQYDEIGADELMNNLPNGVDSALNDANVASPSPNDMQSFDMAGFIKGIMHNLVNYAKTPLIIFCSCFAIVLIIALFESFNDTKTLSMSPLLGTVSSLAIVAVVMTPIISCVEYTANTIHAFSDFMLAYIPVFTSIVASSGAPASAIGYNTSVFALAQIISSITTYILLPFIGAFLSLSIVGSINPQFKINGLTSFVKKAVVIILSLSTTVFLGLFSMQNMITGSTDNLSMKTAKFLSGSFVPVVGSALGDAFSSVMACLSVIKSSIGGFAILVCIISFIPPILTTLFFILTTSMTSALADFFKVSSINGIMSATKDALSIILSFLISISVIIIITTALMLKLGSS